MVSGTENVIHELSSVGNRYRDDWGLVASAWIVRSPPSCRCRSIFREHFGTRACKLFRRPLANSLRIARDSSPILTESPMTASIRRATSLRPGQFKHLIRVASVTGRLPERDVMLLWLPHNTGVRVTELALLEVADVLYPSGVIKPEVYLRAEITKGCRPRNVYLTHPRCLAALEGWISVRLRRR
ncbi:hypothetical protein ALQ34_200045 [Pseudomonas syringae pv. maculicola]|nr:hypothetical protein ALQ34_200045 [Pseudomonas syringae pv. maculicola]